MNSKDIKGFRKKLRMSQEEFARACSVTLMTVSRWERGVSNPSRLASLKLEELKKKKG